MLPELGDPETRELILRPYRIIYTLAQDVRILAVHHGRRAL